MRIIKWREKNKQIVKSDDKVNGYVRLYSLDGGKSKIYRDGISDIIYEPFKKLKEKQVWKNTDFETNYLQMYSNLKDAELFSEILYSGEIRFIKIPLQPYVHIFKGEGIVDELKIIHAPEWEGVVYGMKELTITEQIKAWNHGEVVKNE